MRIGFLLLLVLHAIIHLLWFAHAYGWLELEYFRKEIPGMVGFSWLLAAFFFIRAAIMLGKRRPTWFHSALIGVLISQMWIFSNWEDTKFGSLVNLLVLAGTLVGFAKWEFESRFRQDTRTLFENSRLLNQNRARPWYLQSLLVLQIPACSFP